uniref:Uncharacterized protein n=1 Tax=Solanum tuberosum TaxID=4113 RepID=M1DUL1_SOLTU
MDHELTYGPSCRSVDCGKGVLAKPRSQEHGPWTHPRLVGLVLVPHLGLLGSPSATTSRQTLDGPTVYPGQLSMLVRKPIFGIQSTDHTLGLWVHLRTVGGPCGWHLNF